MRMACPRAIGKEETCDMSYRSWKRVAQLTVSNSIFRLIGESFGSIPATDLSSHESQVVQVIQSAAADTSHQNCRIISRQASSELGQADQSRRRSFSDI